MSLSQNIFDLNTQESVGFSGQKVIPKKTFGFTGNDSPENKENVLLFKSADRNKDLFGLLERIEKRLENVERKQHVLSNGQATIVSNQQAIAQKLELIENNLLLKSELMAQTKALLECKVVLKRVESSVCRITGENPEEKIIEVAAMFPLRSPQSVEEVEKKLEADDFAQAMLMYTHKIKGASDEVSSVVRGVFSDELLQLYNWDGKCEKKPSQNFPSAAR